MFQVLNVLMPTIECHAPFSIPMMHVDNVTPALALKLFPCKRQLLSSADNLCKQFGPRMLVLILIETV